MKLSKPKRAKNAYFIFLKEETAAILAENDGHFPTAEGQKHKDAFAEHTRKIHKKWMSLSGDEQVKYEQQA